MSRALLSLAMAGWMSLSMGATPASAQEFLPAGEAFSLSVSQAESGNVEVAWEVADAHYLYADSIVVENSDGDILSPASQLPPPVVVDDPYFGVSDTYPFDVALEVAPGDADQVTIRWQGCAEAGMCYAPQSAELDLTTLTLSGMAATAGDPAAALLGDRPPINGKPDAGGPEDAPEQASGPRAALDSTAGARDQGEDQAFAQRLASGNVGIAILAFFGMGLLLTFTPCVLPMLPIVSSLVVGAGGGVGRGAALSGAYVIPMALTYAALGAVAALAGANLQAALQTPAVLGSFAGLFVLFALAMFGVFELQLPSGLRQRLDRISGRQRGGTLRGAASLGVLSALLVGPCMTAPLAGALLYITETGDVWLGASALLALGLGMGVPVMVVGTLGSAILPKPGPWMERVKACFGFVLLGMALWFASRVLPGGWTLGLTGGLVIAVALALWHIEGRGKVYLVAARTLALALVTWGATMIVGTLIGGDDPRRPLAPLVAGAPGIDRAVEGGAEHEFRDAYTLSEVQAEIEEAERQGRWTVIDVYADWCVSCQKIEHEVLKAPEVQAALDDFHLVRADITDSTPGTEALMQHYRIMGPPTLLLVAPGGIERRSERLVGEFEVDEALAALANAGERQGEP